MKKKLSLVFNVSAAEARRALDAPFDNNVVETFHGVPVSDPFRPLEKLGARKTTAWVARQNKKYKDFIAPAAKVKADAMAFLEASVPKGMRESMPSRVGDKWSVWRTDPDAIRDSLYIKDVPDYAAPARLLLDPMKIDPTGKTDIAGARFSDDGKTLAYRLSVSGSDETTLKFMDVATGKDLGLTYKKFRSGVDWDGDGQGFHYNHQISKNSKSMEVRYHKMGTRPEDDKVVFTPPGDESYAAYFTLNKDSKDQDGDYEWVSVTNVEEGKNALLMRPTGSAKPFHEIFPHKEGTLSPIHEIGGKVYAMTSLGAPNEKLVCFDPNDPAPEKWQTILPENKDDPLTSVFIWQNKIFATYSHDTGEQLKVFNLSGGYLYDVPIPPLSTYSMGNFDIADSKCLISYDNFQESGNVYEYDAAKNTLTLYHKSQMPIDLKDCIVERLYAVSKDGTKVPMTVVRAPGTKLDGTAATLLYGYGGFNVPLTPIFSKSIAQWVRTGGIYVQANLRGGGEYGQAWYDAGRGKNKQNVFDDFAACAEHLIKTNYTAAKRLAIQGGSNGGLLTLATMLQRPELFGAVISEVPVADMFRFHIGSYYGYGWKHDYGDPDIKKDFMVAAQYSPLHNVKHGVAHPPLLINTDANDDRVLPWHSYKMTATLQGREAPGAQTFLHVKTDGGHGDGMAEKQRFEDVASMRAFLHMTLGPVDQAEYKKMLQSKMPGRPLKP